MQDVSVIIPTYNRGYRLKRAIESVLAQRALPREIIVVDDGSSDSTKRSVYSWNKHSSIPLIYLYQDNQGPAAARNTGIRRASGGVLAFLDSDDEWHKDKIFRQLHALKEEPAFLISHTKERWLRQGKHLNQKAVHEPTHGFIFEQSLKLCCVGMSTVMARKELFERYGFFDESLRCCEDYDLWLRIAPFEPFLLVDERLTIKHGGRDDQVSQIYRIGMDRFRIQALANLMETVPLHPEKKSAAGRELIRRCTIFGTGCLKHGRVSEADFYKKLSMHFTQAHQSKFSARSACEYGRQLD